MIVALRPDAPAGRVRSELRRLGLWCVEMHDRDGGTSFYVEPHSRSIDRASLEALDGVARVYAPESAHPMLDRQGPVVDVSGVRVGASGSPLMMAGPCSVESPEQIERMARDLARRGATFLRGGADKPRTSPYAFQGHGEAALSWLREAADRHGLLVVTEALSEETVDAVAERADLIQIGSRNMHNYALLKRVAASGRPLLLKRGMAATVDEWLQAAEYGLVHGAPAVIFCERGVRGFDASTRNVLDLASVALLAHVHRQPVIVDPSHAVGRRDLILPLGRAAIAAGACGLLVEVHDRPEEALSDAPQSLGLEPLERLAKDIGATGVASPSLRGERSVPHAGPRPLSTDAGTGR